MDSPIVTVEDVEQYIANRIKELEEKASSTNSDVSKDIYTCKKEELVQLLLTIIHRRGPPAQNQTSENKPTEKIAAILEGRKLN